MTVVDTIKEAVGLDGSSESSSMIFCCLGHAVANKDHSRSCFQTSDVRGEASSCIQRQLRTSSDPTKSVSVQRVLPALEVCGMSNIPSIQVGMCC